MTICTPNPRFIFTIQFHDVWPIFNRAIIQNIILLVFSWPILAKAMPATSPITEQKLVVGHTHKLTTVPGGSVKVRGKGVIAIEDFGDHLKIIAKKIGVAEVQTPNKIFKFIVINENQNDFYFELEKLLTQYRGLKLGWQNGELVITGQILRLSDWQNIFALAKNHSGQFIMRASLEPEIKNAAHNWLLSIIKQAGLKEPYVTLDFGTEFILPEAEKTNLVTWQNLAHTLGATLRLEKEQLQVQPLVRVNIVIAEVNKKLQNKIGIEWPTSVSAKIAPSLQTPNQLEVFLKAMEENGLGQILASPNLLAKSGSEASFLAGGEFGIRIISPRVKDVIWKKHGIYLKIKPMADRTGHLNIELNTEISLIDGAQAVDGIPALKTNSLTTHFNMRSARTIVLSGLVRHDWGESDSGIAGLARLPIIGSLFKSRDFFNNKTELVIFVTPEIMSDNPQNTKNSFLPQMWSQRE